jgi:hypothetical protein
VKLRDWLVSSDNRGTVQKRLHGFIYSLLVVTRERLETVAKIQGDYFPTARRISANGITGISKLPCLSEEAAKERYGEEPMKCVSWVKDRQKKLAYAFREHMTKGQLYLTSSPNRAAFYARVTAMAEQVNSLSFLFPVRMTVFSSLWKMETRKNVSMGGTFHKAKACKKQARCSVAS